MEFGEQVLYLRPGPKGKDKMLSRWESAIWLGLRDESGEVIIGTPIGCLKVREVIRYGQQSHRWNLEAFDSFRGVPWEPVPGSATTNLKSKVKLYTSDQVHAHGIRREKDFLVSRFRINRKDFSKLGFTPLCPWCRAPTRQVPAQHHTELCRPRVHAELERTCDLRIEKSRQMSEQAG